MTARSGLRPAQVANSEDAGDDPLEDARRSATDFRWRDVYEALSRTDRRSALAVEDLELLATAAFLLGRGEECRHAWLRAYQIHVNSGNFRRAALCAVRIGLDQISTGEIAQVAGCLPASLTSCLAWVAQASALLEREEDCPEHGYLLIPVAYEQLAMEGDAAGAAGTSARAVEVGRRFGDPDLLALGLTIQGRAMVRSWRLGEGMAMLDEAVAVVVAGDVSPSIAGIVLTSAVDASEEAFDLRRLGEWTETLAAWCELQQGMVAFQSRSLAHRATLSQLQGRWDEALEAAQRARDHPIAEADATAAAAAHYRQGEVLRLRGDRPAAEAAYREASRRGLDPQPALALLRLAEGDTKAAVASIGRALGESHDKRERARILPAWVEILLASGDLPAAAEAAEELEEVAAYYGAPILDAIAQHARGAVLLAKGDGPAALKRLRQACRVWRHFGLPYEEGRSRLLVAQCCRLLGDEDTAALELGAARQIFILLAAGPDLTRTYAIFGETSPPSTHGLTKRELEVLRLLATGLTNRSIADELMVAVRTVDSHVSSIFTKLGVSSRAAATGFAHRHDLV
jgi:DNA-binding CsgD family transcriptional regulator